MRLKLIIAYDGRPFRGWQSQTGGGAVQDFLESALRVLCGGGERVAVHGAGRTDAGVHALAQCAHAEIADVFRSKPLDWRAALNANLPREIRVLRCARAARDFHARFSAKGKIYRYRIWNAPVLSPFELGRAWHFPGELNLDGLRTATAQFVGAHDFSRFAASRGKPEASTWRTIHALAMRSKTVPDGRLITLEFRGDGFLYKMVRLMTGTLVRVAQGRAEPAWISTLLRTDTKLVKTSFAAPADGLYLTRVLY